MPIFPILQTEDLVQSGDKTRLDATQSFASGSATLSTVAIRPAADEIFYNVSEDKYIDWVYTHSGVDNTVVESFVATVRAHALVVIDDTNDKIDFTLSADPGTVITATIAHGSYETNTPLFAAIETALAAATLAGYPLLTWNVGTSGLLTEITVDELDVTSGDTVTLLPVTGPNAATSILPLLGFSVDQAATRALIDDAGKTFTQAFAADTGFTYDSALSEFTGGLVRQKDQRPTNGVLAATYTSSKDLNWAPSGSLVATDIGAPVLSGGKLLCTTGGNVGVKYSNANIGASGNVGALRLRYTPNYSGTPVTNTNIFEFAPQSGNNDRALVFHSSTGTLRLTAYTSVGSIKYSAIAFNASPWVPVAGTEYEFEFDWDTVAGTVRLFVNGVLHGSMSVSSYARGTAATDLYIGAGTVYPVSNASFNDVLLFSIVQHTAGYTPGYTISETIYPITAVTLPTLTYPGPGVIQVLTGFTTTEVSAPRYTLNAKYFNGTAWVASDGSYAQANPKATVLANLATLTVGVTTLVVAIVFTGSNTQSSVDQMDFVYTGQLLDNEVILDADKAAVDIHVDTSITVSVISASKDNLFATDADLVKHEWNIMKFLPEGRSSYKNVHREAQSLILAWLDTHGFVDDLGNKFTVADIQNPDDLNKWATMMALRLIFEGIHNAEDDVFESKAKKYEGLEMFYRNRANMRIDTNGDGDATNVESLDTRSCRVVRR